MVGMDSHFYDQTSPLNSSFDSNKASSRVSKCVSPTLQHVTHGSEGIPTDLNSPELTFDHMSIQQFIRNENNQNETSTNQPIEDSLFQGLINSNQQKNQVASGGHRQTSLNTHYNLNPVQSASSVNNNLHQTGNSHSSQYTSSYQQHQHQQNTPMPQQPSIGTNRYGLEAGSTVKQEPLDSEDFSTNTCSQNSVFVPSQFASNYGNDTRINNTNNSRSVEPTDKSNPRHMPFNMGTTTSSVSSHQVRNSNRGSKNSSKKQIDKGSDEYKKRRERNNIAVRKSREKAKIRSRETEKKVAELARENEQLKKKVDSLCKELNVLKSLLTTVGVPPENVDSEIEKGLQMESHMQSNFNSM